MGSELPKRSDILQSSRQQYSRDACQFVDFYKRLECYLSDLSSCKTLNLTYILQC